MNATQSEHASLGDILAAALQSAPDLTDEEAMACVGGWVAVEITNALTADFYDVWRVLTHLPEGYLRFLETPEGWTALGFVVAAELGTASAPIFPAIH